MNGTAGLRHAALGPSCTPPALRSLCFVAPYGYPLLAGDRDTPLAGGAEVQQCTLAREFVLDRNRAGVSVRVTVTPGTRFTITSLAFEPLQQHRRPVASVS